MAQKHHGVRVVALVVGLIVVGVGVALAVRVHGAPSTVNGKLLGEAAPAFRGPTLSGHVLDSRTLAGRIVLVNFWNDWCLPCQQETPALRQFYERHGADRDFSMVGIVRDPKNGDAAIRAYARAEHMDWTLVRDPTGQAALDYGTTGQPETFMIDGRGVVVAYQAGPASVANLEEMLHRARGTG